MNLGTLPARHAAYRGHHPAVVFEDVRLDYAAFDARINRVANALASLGLAPGDKVATLLSNGLPLYELYWAAARLGLVVVPLSPLMRGEALRALLTDCDAALLVTERALASGVDEIRPRLPGLPADMYALVDHDGRPGYHDYQRLCSAAPPTAPPPVAVDADAPYNIIYSSGTTGLPKGIVLSHRVRLAYCTTFATVFRMTPESVVLHAGSIVFNGAFLTLMPAMYLGATYVLQRQFDPAAFVAAVRRERATHVMLVPSQIVALLGSPAFSVDALASLQMVCSVGAPLHRVHKEALHEALPGRFYELYGLTEGFVTVLDKEDAGRKLASVGVPPALSELRILRDDGSVAGAGEVGEIAGRGPLLMSGYHGRPAETAEALSGGWLHSGDLGFVDDDGFLHLVDRKKDLIISGGINVYPRDIEEVIVRHPAVREAVVFGVPDARWGEAPVAAVRVHHAIDKEVLRHFINDVVAAKYQRVRDVVIVDELPRNASGKVLKRVLRETWLAGGGGNDAFVRSGDVRLHYLRDRGGPLPLVLLHGLSANARFFEPLVSAGLARRHDVIRLDLRGRGLSDQPERGYAVADHARDVLALLDALGIAQAVLCGHSYGGLVALWLAAHHPERVRHQILMDIAGPTIHNEATFRLVQPSLERLGRVFASMDDYLAHVQRLPWLDGRWTDELLPYFRADVTVRQDGTVQPRTSRDAIMQVVAAAQREPWAEIVAAARVPALVLHAPDPFGPPGAPPIVSLAQAQDLVASLPDAAYVAVPGNHVTMVTGDGGRAIVAAIDELGKRWR